MAASPCSSLETTSSLTNGDTQSQTSQDSITSSDSVGGQQVVFRRNKVNGHHSDDKNPRDEGVIRRRSASVLEVKEHAHSRLKEELLKALQELKVKDEEVKKLSSVQDLMNQELEDLTASLFEEANKMVQDANVKRMNQEKLLKEANAKVEVLEAEVIALKSLVITSTPSMPNRHLHPQLEPPPPQPSGGGQQSSKGSKIGFIKGHRRSTSHHNISREVKLSELQPVPVQQPLVPLGYRQLEKEVDPVYFEEFKQWRDTCPPSLELTHSFVERLTKEDIKPCLAFSNSQLAKSAFECIVKNTLTIDPVQERNLLPSKCALTESCQLCKYNLRLGDNDPGHLISQRARNRIAAVCDLITYLRYICQGLVKSDDKDIYWEIMRLQKQICLSRLGFS